MKRPFADEPVWMPVHNILICDARPGIRQAVTRMARHIHTAANVDFVTDGYALLAAYAAKPADLVLIGLPPGTPDGTAAIKRLLNRHPLANVIAYGSVRDTALLTAAVAGGAHGFLLWTADQWPPPPTPTSSRPPQQPVRTQPAAGAPRRRTDIWPDPPTERELQVLRGISRGQTNREIGSDLFLSVDTVKTHASRLFRRLGANDRGHAVALGMRNGLVT